MKKASLATAFAASLFFGSAAAVKADEAPALEARAAEERVLGSADDEARFRAYLPFTREIAADGVVSRSLDAALAEAGVTAATMLEARQALATVIDLDRDVRPGDRFHVRYEQTFTAEGAPVGIGRVLWVELRTKAKGVVAIHRFRSHDKTERFWLANGHPASPTSMRLPLDVISISSGFGLRADPFDQPPPMAVSGKPAPMGGPKRNMPLPPGLPTGGVSGNGTPAFNVATPLGVAAGLTPYGNWQAAPRKAHAAVHARRRRSRGAGRHAGLCRGRRRRGRRRAQRPLRQLDPHRSRRAGSRRSTAISRRSRRASDRARRWCAAS